MPPATPVLMTQSGWKVRISSTVPAAALDVYKRQDPKRKLIGDDEHGWDDEGVFNYEGGCYAKVINLDKDSEPDIYNAIKRDALLENVTVAADGKIDFTDKSVTENTRVSYPIYHIENIVKPISKGPHAQQVIFLSADAFGVDVYKRQRLLTLTSRDVFLNCMLSSLLNVTDVLRWKVM